MKKKGHGRSILGTSVVAGVVLFLLSHTGVLHFGEGTGDSNVETETVTEGDLETIEELDEITITIVVTQDQYLIDGQEVTLTQIKEKVTDTSAKIKVILEDNYASTKAWDEIKRNLTEWEIVPIEQ